MKKLSKLIAVAFAAAAFFITTEVKAQTTPANAFTFSLGVAAGVPTGNAHNYSTFNLGGTGRLQYGITNNFAVLFETGGDHFFSKTIPGTDVRYASYGVIPLKGGVKGFIAPHIYIAGEAGAGFEVLEHGLFRDGQTKLILAPSAGWANKHWDVGVRYDSFTGDGNNYGTVGVRVAYGFQL
jgi:hypothetical protein